MGRVSRAQAVHETLDKLKQQYREVLVLYYLHELSLRQCAVHMGLPLQDLRQVKDRACQQFRELFPKGALSWTR